jgi:ABC-2 type transport system ATP-binding protein
MSNALVVEGVGKSYGRVAALSGVDLTVAAGAIVGLLGPNGAGKSTLVRICSTLLLADTGRVSVAGYDVVRQADAVRAAIGMAGQATSVDNELTGYENLRMLAQLHRLPRRSAELRVGELVDRFDLAAVVSRRAGTYSGGTRRRLDLACAFMGEPRVVFLDEPTVGLDPRSRSEVWDQLAKVTAAGVTVLLATQYLEEAEYLADRIVVVDHGRVLADDSIDTLKARHGDPRLEVVVRQVGQLSAAAVALSGFTEAQVEVDERLRRLVIPLPGGASRLGSVVDAFTAHGVDIDDVALRRPTLDEVFLAITGRASDGGATTGGVRP